MNKEFKNIHQCSQCKKDFPSQEVYRIGIKEKDFFCRDCANNIKSNCMWCGKDLEQKKWERLGGYWIKSEEGRLTETIDRDNLDGDKHHRYYLICEEGREWGIRPNGSCASRYNDFSVKKGNKKRLKRQNEGWKECQGKALYHKTPQTGKVVCDMNCWELVPPGEKHCKKEGCVYFTAVFNGIDSEERKKIRQRWNHRDQEKYRKANEWWNSLSLVQKQAELTKEEEHLTSLGLQRQRCWIERLDKNSILFENGKLHYDNLDKIPPSFLDRFGYPGFQWESVWKNDNNHSHALQATEKREEEISNKKTLLEQAKQNGDDEAVAKLEQQIQELKSQQKVNSTANENSTNHKDKIITYSIIGLTLVSLTGFVLWLSKPKRKNPKIN